VVVDYHSYNSRFSLDDDGVGVMDPSTGSISGGL